MKSGQAEPVDGFVLVSRVMGHHGRSTERMQEEEGSNDMKQARKLQTLGTEPTFSGVVVVGGDAGSGDCLFGDAGFAAADFAAEVAFALPPFFAGVFTTSAKILNMLSSSAGAFVEDPERDCVWPAGGESGRGGRGAGGGGRG